MTPSSHHGDSGDRRSSPPYVTTDQLEHLASLIVERLGKCDPESEECVRLRVMCPCESEEHKKDHEALHNWMVLGERFNKTKWSIFTTVMTIVVVASMGYTAEAVISRVKAFFGQ